MPERSGAAPGARAAARLAAFAVAYFLAAELGHALTIQPRAFATFWAPSGVFLAGLLLADRRRWPILVLAALVPSTASNLLHGRSLGTALAFFAGNVLESLAAAAIVGWAVGGARPSLGKVRDVLALVVGGAVLGPAIAASAGAGLLALQGAPFGETWLLWWSGSAVGVLVVAGPALAFAGGPPPRWPGWPRAGERAAVAAAVGVAGWAITSAPTAIYSQEFVLIPPLLWAAIRTGPRGATLAGAASSLLVVFASQRGLGHLAATSADTLGSLRFFLGLFLTTALLVAAAFEERRSEASARRLIQAAVDEGADAVLVLDVDGGVRWASAALGRLVGRAPGELVGRPVWTVKPGLGEAGWRAWLEALRQRGATVAEETLPRAEGGASPFEVVGSLVEVDGELHVLASLRDISDRRQAEAALRLAGVGTLAAGVAHEINNPLAYVIGNLAVARELVSRGGRGAGAAEGPDLALALDDAHDGAIRVRDIVRDLNLFSRPNEGTGPVDVRVAARAAVSMAANEVRHRARLEVVLDEPVPPVEGNEGRMAQVLLNLLMNAAQAIPEGRAGSNLIRLEVRRGHGAWVVAEVSDTGTGMTPEVAARIFEPFFTTKPVGAGTGLGLAICHGLVKAMGGRVEVETEVGRGSRFRVLLPAAASAAPPAAPPEAAPAAGPRRRILVVDDEAPVARAVARMLREDFEVTTATDARTALALLDAGRDFDAVLCDLMMPEVTGMELHAELLRRGSPLAARVVFMTGGAFTEAAREYLGRVPNPRVEKPFDAAQLRGALSGEPAAAP